MNSLNLTNSLSRRHFLKTSSVLAAGAAVAPYVITSHAEDDTPIRIGLVGCGSRGLGAVGNALAAGKNIKLVALADVFPDRIKEARAILKDFGKNVAQAANWAAGTESADMTGVSIEIPDEMCFTGFDAYEKLMKVADINYVILASPPGFRPFHIKAAIEAGKNVFAEKPVAVDPFGVRMILAAGKMAAEKKLGFVAGTQRRHSANYVEVIKRIHDGEIGEITSARAFWNQGTVWMKPRKPEWSDMEWQLRDWTYFTWLAGDIIVEQHLHNIDVINWATNSHPVKAFANGGRARRTGPEFGNIYDNFSVEFEYPNGMRMTSMCRQIDNVANAIGEEVTGTKGRSDCCKIIKTDKVWRRTAKFRNPYEQEHVDLIASIRAGTPLNEAQAVAESNLAAIMGREAAYSGQSVDWDSTMESEMNLAPKKYEFGPLEVKPVAVPGVYKFE